MGSRLGVQRGRKQEYKQSSSTEFQQNHHHHHHAQFPIGTEPHQHPATYPHTAREGTAAATSNHRLPTSTPGYRSTSDASTANSSTATTTSSSSSNRMNNSQRQAQPQQMQAPPPPPPVSAPPMRRGDLVRRLSSARSMRSFDSLDSPSGNYRSTTTPGTSMTTATVPISAALNQQLQAEKERRKVEAEKILEEIAKEYAAKRAAGLVPTIPVPARTLLWEELARNERNRVGKRGQCVFGRDTDNICGCQSYKKKKIKGQENPGGICECCNHGAPWHRLAGGSMTQRSSRGGYTRSYAGSSVRASRIGSMARSEAPSTYSSMGGSEYDDEYYDEDYDDDDDDDDDDEDIAMEVARPYNPHEGQTNQSFLPYNNNYGNPHHPHHQFIETAPPTADSEYDYNMSNMSNRSIDRSSMFSSNSSLGLPPRLSSGANQLEALLKAIKRYRQLGLSEDEIEERIREDFPPMQRNNNSVIDSMPFASGELASM